MTAPASIWCLNPLMGVVSISTRYFADLAEANPTYIFFEAELDEDLDDGDVWYYDARIDSLGRVLNTHYDLAAERNFNKIFFYADLIPVPAEE